MFPACFPPTLYEIQRAYDERLLDCHARLNAFTREMGEVERKIERVLARRDELTPAAMRVILRPLEAEQIALEEQALLTELEIAEAKKTQRTLGRMYDNKAQDELIGATVRYMAHEAPAVARNAAHADAATEQRAAIDGTLPGPSVRLTSTAELNRRVTERLESARAAAPAAPVHFTPLPLSAAPRHALA